MAKIINKNSIKFKILSVVFFSLFVLTSALGYLSFQFSKSRIIAMLGESLKGISATIASLTPAEDISFIVKNSDKIKAVAAPAYDSTLGMRLPSPKSLDQKPELPKQQTEDPRALYDKYSSLLRIIKRVNNIDSSINIYMATGNRLRIVLTSEQALLVGAEYVMRPEARVAISSGLARATGVYKDKDGTWISAYAPGGQLSYDDGRIVAEVNYKIDSYMRMLHKDLVIIIIICVAGFLIVAFMSYHLVTALVSAIKKLNEAVGDLEKEHYDKPINIKADDEIGHLATTFELMRLSIKKKIEELRLSLRSEKRAHLESVVALTNAIEERDPYTKEHVSRVQKYALLIAKAMHLSHDDIVQLRYSCLLHDIGKIYIENALLKKVDLTHEDFEEIKKHAERGAKIIEGIEFLTDVKDAVLCHQEWYNGKGYPRGLKGNEIPLLARIVSVADAFDAMTTNRPYRPKMGFRKAMDEIENKSGTQFDPVICTAFLKYRDTLESMMGEEPTDGGKTNTR